MFDAIQASALEILSLSIGGVSLFTILAFTYYVIKFIRKFKKDNAVTKDVIQDAIKEAFVPTNYKIDLSKKLEGPLKEGLQKIQENLDTELLTFKENLRVILSIVSKFNHVERLSEEDKQLLDKVLAENGNSNIVEVEA